MKNIVLTGMPGCGKTTVSQVLLSLINGFSLIDIDEEIVRAEKRSINDIFEKDGEKYFRDIETQTLKKFSAMNNLIISTGGGIVERDENIGILKKSGVVFYLFADIDTLLERVKSDTSRPLLKVDDIKERLQTLFNRRDEKYRRADFVIDTLNLKPDKIAQMIIKEIGYDRN